MILIYLELISFASLKCAFYQNDRDSAPQKYPEPIEPFINHGGNKACPSLNGIPACCTQSQIDSQCIFINSGKF